MIEFKKILEIESTNKYPVVLIPDEIKKFLKNYDDVLRYHGESFTMEKKKYEEYDKKIEILKSETISFYKLKETPTYLFDSLNWLNKPTAPLKIDETELLKKHNYGSGFDRIKMNYNDRFETIAWIIPIGLAICGIILLKKTISDGWDYNNITIGLIFTLILFSLPIFIVRVFILENKKYLKFKRETEKEFLLLKEKYEIAYNKEIKEYYKRLEKYEHAEKEKTNSFSKIVYTKMSDYLIVKYKNNFRSDLTIERAMQVPNKGKSEKIFLVELLKYFNDKILVDMAITSSGKEIFYPDFIYFDRETNLIIDIEIDEEFESSTKRPIHFIGGDDEERNKFFTGNNWFVIRFTEGQVIKNAKECCEFLNDIIFKIQNPNYIGLYDKQFDILKTYRWTYEESMVKLNLK